MNVCIYKGIACKYASMGGYCTIGDRKCIRENPTDILDDVDDFNDYLNLDMFFDLFDEE